MADTLPIVRRCRFHLPQRDFSIFQAQSAHDLRAFLEVPVTGALFIKGKPSRVARGSLGSDARSLTEASAFIASVQNRISVLALSRHANSKGCPQDGHPRRIVTGRVGLMSFETMS